MENIDVVVIGGGCAGAGVARDLSMRKIPCLLLGGRRTRSRRGLKGEGLLHGGAFFVEADPVAARECRGESRVLLRIAGHYARETSGLVVILPGENPRRLDRMLGVMAQVGVYGKRLSTEKALKMEPALNPGIAGAVETREVVVDEAALESATLRSAMEHGARDLRDFKPVSLLIEDGHVRGVRAARAGSGEEIEIGAECVVMTAAAHVAGLDVPPEVGGHLVMLRENRVLLEESPCAGVVCACGSKWPCDVALLPGGNGVIVEIIEESEETVLSPGRVDRMIEKISGAVPVVAECRALRAVSGVIPALRLTGPRKHAPGLGAAVLNHGVLDGLDGLYTVVDGGVTTHRLASEMVCDAVCRRLGIDARCSTHLEVLPLIEDSGGVDSRGGRYYERCDILPPDLESILQCEAEGPRAMKACMIDWWEEVAPVAWGKRLREVETARSIIIENFNLDEVE